MKSSVDQVIVTELESTHQVVAGGLDDSCDADTALRTFTLSVSGVTVYLSNVGASISRILIPSYAESSRPGSVDDVVLGFESPAAMIECGNPLYFCAIVGRVANRVAKGRFRMPETQHEYILDTNNGPNHLHGGIQGFHQRIWDASVVQTSDHDDALLRPSVRFTLNSRDGDQGYPGSVKVQATYSLSSTPSGKGAALHLSMTAEFLNDIPTPINLANHSYFNLGSHNAPSGILDHKLTMPSESYTPLDSTAIPTREVRHLDGDSSMDFRRGKSIRDALIQFGIENASLSNDDAIRNVSLSGISPDIGRDNAQGEPYGFDHNYVVKKSRPGMNVAGVLEHEGTRRRLTVLTDAPGVQLYTGNFLDGVSLDKRFCKGGSVYRQWQGICLETQHYPDSIGVDENLFPEFARGQCFLLKPGGPRYKQNVEYRFEPMSNDVEGSSPEARSERGTDSDGNVYNSIDEMWESQGVLQTDEAHNNSWYNKTEDYYERNCPATIDGVLGGFASISDLDLVGSVRFLDRVRQERPSLDWSSGPACECGAGIGRVSKDLLLPLGVTRCDLIESSSRLLSAAPANIGDSGADRCHYYCVGLQDWEPPTDTYCIIWIQWVLCYLTDADVIAFLRRCGHALLPGGIVCLKENTCAEGKFVLDNEDASVTRSLSYLLRLVDAAGLRVVLQETQNNFPEELFPVPMLALDLL